MYNTYKLYINIIIIIIIYIILYIFLFVFDILCVMSIARLELDQDTESCNFHNVDINMYRGE